MLTGRAALRHSRRVNTCPFIAERRRWIGLGVGILGLSLAGCGDTQGADDLTSGMRDLSVAADLVPPMDQSVGGDVARPVDLTPEPQDFPPGADIAMLPEDLSMTDQGGLVFRDMAVPEDLTIVLDLRPPPDQMPPPPADMTVIRDLVNAPMDGGARKLAFAAAVTSAQGAPAISMATGDANGDSKPDLFLALFGKPGVHYFANGGGLMFAAAVEVGVASQPTWVAAGDLDGDKRPEVLAVSADQLLTVRINGGVAAYNKGATYMLPMGPSSVEVGDFNGDRNLDAVVAAKDSSNVNVLLGAGNGALGLPAMTMVTAGGQYALPLDFDKDGKLDVVVAAPPGVLATYTGGGLGTFVKKAELMAGVGAQHIAAGRLDGDQFDDLVVSSVQASRFSVYRGAANGVFLAAVDYQTAGMPAASGIADFDQDGALDVAVGAFNLVQIFRGQGDGTFVLGLSLPVNGNNRCVVPVDLDGDGLVDLAVCNANNLALIKNTSM